MAIIRKRIRVRERAEDIPAQHLIDATTAFDDRPVYLPAIGVPLGALTPEELAILRPWTHRPEDVSDSDTSCQGPATMAWP